MLSTTYFVPIYLFIHIIYLIISVVIIYFDVFIILYYFVIISFLKNILYTVLICKVAI